MLIISILPFIYNLFVLLETSPIALAAFDMPSLNASRLHTSKVFSNGND